MDDPRSLWKPPLARVYGLLPWQIEELTPDEWIALVKDYDALTKAK